LVISDNFVELVTALVVEFIKEEDIVFTQVRSIIEQNGYVFKNKKFVESVWRIE
tara:strand:- start:42 stop:203 length:162 start_codon:yes stop_codon:yes gene_type:complete